MELILAEDIYNIWIEYRNKGKLWDKRDKYK